MSRRTWRHPLNCVIEAGGQRALHGGNTLLHGYGGFFAQRGPIDLAVLLLAG